MILLDFEKEILNNQKGVTVEVSDAAINEKYEKGEARIITEQGAVKLSLVKQVFNAENYQLINWIYRCSIVKLLSRLWNHQYNIMR